MIDLDAIREIEERGFAVVRGVLPDGSVGPLRVHLELLLAAAMRQWRDAPGYIDDWMVHNPMATDIRFARVLENQVLHGYLSELLGPTCILYAFTTSSMPPRGTNYSHRIHNDCPRHIPGYITNVGVILPLDDFTSENGATWFLPGSHRLLAPPSDHEFFSGAVRVYPMKGDAVLFNARVYHVGGFNATDTPRHALTLNVCRSFMRQRFDYPRLVPPRIVEQLTDIGKRFLGFDVRMPVSLDEYYVPEDQRLYKAGQG